MGIINAGSAIGAVAAPPLIAMILLYESWRWVFVACSGAGLVWAALWWSVYRPPYDGVQTLARGRTVRERDARAAGTDTAEPPMAWAKLLGMREVWGLVAAKFLTDAAWFFYISWLPKYLYDARHFDVKQVGAYAWVPYAASGAGCLLGGWFSSALIRRGRSVDFSRKCALGLSAAVMPAIVFVTRVPVEWALAIFSLAFFGQQSWSTLVMIVPTDLFGQRIVASVAGLVGFGGAMGGLLMNVAAGRLLDAGFTYAYVFAIVGTLHVIAFAVILVAIPRIQPPSGYALTTQT
jgi:ACS family hexuronate transporter-like MFS transporter